MPLREVGDRTQHRHEEQDEPGDPLGDVVACNVSQFVSCDKTNLVVAEASVQERVPEDDTLARPDAHCVRVGRGGLVADLLFENLRIARMLALLELLDLCSKLPIVERMRVDA